MYGRLTHHLWVARQLTDDPVARLHIDAALLRVRRLHHCRHV